MLTRSHRLRSGLQLQDFDLDPHLSNSAELPPPIQTLPEFQRSVPPPPQQVPLETIHPALFSDSPLTSLAPTMAENDNPQAGPSNTGSITLANSTDPSNSSSPSPHVVSHPLPVSPPVYNDKRPQDYKVEKFHESSALKSNGSNFVTWRRRMVIAFRNHKWEPYALGTIPCPDISIDPTGYSVWRHIDSLVLSQISSNMEDSLFGEISTDTMTASDLWSRIHNRFEELSELAQATAHARLCGKRMKEGDSLKDHIWQLRKLKADYTSAGGSLTDKQWLSIVVTSLEEHSQWHQVDLYADIIDDAEKLIRKLELKEIRGFGTPFNDQLALPAQQQPKYVPPPRLGRRFPPGKPCPNCKRGVHSVANCWAPGGGAVHRRPPGYKVPLDLLDRERADLAAQLRNLDQQRAQLISAIQPTSSLPSQTATANLAAPDFDRSVRQEILMVVGNSPKRDPEAWILDSGATSHMSWLKERYESFQSIEPIPIYTARENEVLYATGIGSVRVLLQVNDEQVSTLISNVLYVPEICANLISLSKLDERGLEYKGKRGRMEFSREGKSVLCATKVHDQWFIDVPSVVGYSSLSQSIHLVTTKTDSSQPISIWHQRLAHIGQKRILELFQQNSVSGLEISDATPSTCEGCVLSKMTAVPNHSRTMRASHPGDIVHADLEFMGHKSFSQCDISLKFIDEYSNFVWVYSISNKSASTILSHWSALVSTFLTQFAVRVKALHTDNGTEFVNAVMDRFNQERGIEHHKIVPYRHEMNGRVERLNRTGSNSVRSMILASGLPNAYWAEAYDTFAYIHNRTSSSAIPAKTPYESLYKRQPQVSHIRIFGCTAYMRIPPEERRKLDPKARKLVLVGYRDDAAYRLFDPLTRQVHYSKDVVFDELRSFVVHQDPPQATIQDVMDRPHATIQDVTDEDVEPTPRRSTRVIKPTARKLQSVHQDLSLAHLDHPHHSNISSEQRLIAGIPIPRSFNEANSSPQSSHWIQAMQYEISKLEGMECWDIVEAPPDVHLIKGLWVFNVKPELDGSLLYRARWVARGDSQIPGLEFDETFASTGDYVIARLVFAMSTMSSSRLITLDINSAYLHSPLEEDNLYVAYPTGFAVPGFNSPCCKLRRALYGLRQGARAWNVHLSNRLASLGFKNCISAPSAYVRSTNEGEIVMSTHSDDLQAACNSLIGERHTHADQFKKQIGSIFEFTEKDTREKAKILGMSVDYDDKLNRVKVSVGMKIDDMLVRYNMQDSKAVDSPMIPNALAIFEKDESEAFEHPPWPYAKLIGELMWIGNTVRPDIAFAINALARQLKAPKQSHWEAAKRILRYLKGSKDLGIVYDHSSSREIIGYSDSDWATDPSDRKSTTGYVFTYVGGAVSWRSRKQTVVATSTAEAEYLAASSATNEAKWLRAFFTEINHHDDGPTTIFVDNMAAIHMTRNPIYYSKTKHIDLRAHHLRDEVQNNTIRLEHIQGDLNPADILTKPLSPLLHKRCVELLGMK